MQTQREFDKEVQQKSIKPSVSIEFLQSECIVNKSWATSFKSEQRRLNCNFEKSFTQKR